MSSWDLILGFSFSGITRDYRSTGAGGTFTRVPFPLTLELRPVRLSPGPDVLWS